MYYFKKIIPAVSHSSIPRLTDETIDIRIFDSENPDFTLNDDGHIRNDFSTLMAREDSRSMALALSRLREFDSQSNLPKGCTFEQAVKLIRPRWCQSPAEMDRFETYLIDNALDLYRKLKSDIDDSDLQSAIASAKSKQLETENSSGSESLFA